MPSVARLTGIAFGAVLALAVSISARAAGLAEELFQLVPPDAAATLAIEDLRSRAREFLASPLFEGFRRLPAFQAWIASDRFAGFEQARQRLESVLGEKVATIRDELLGDAVVLSLRVPPDGRPEEARGLLLVRVRDRPLLDRLIDGLNAAQSRSGELTRLTRSSWSGVAYWSREFLPASRKPAEYYTVLGDNTFAWSNSEDLVQGVIDRSAGRARSLGDEPRFQRVRRRLPEQAAVSLFVDPLFLAQRLNASAKPQQQKPNGDRAAALLGRYLGAMDYLGAALEWREGFLLHTEEILEPRKLDPWVRRWAAGTGEIAQGVRRAPPTALAMASVHLDFTALLDILRDLVPHRQQPRLENLIVALNGVLVGHDLQAKVLPQLGPGVLAYAEAPDPVKDSPDARLSKVIVIGLGNATGLAAAVENALQTYLAFYALDPHHGNGLLQLESREGGGRKVTSLGPGSPLAFAIDRDRLVLGSSATAVARAISQAANPAEGEFERLRATRFPQAGSFACVDLERSYQYVLRRRAALVARLAARRQRTPEEAERDLDEAIALMAMFRHAYITSAIEPDATAVHRSVGLIPRSAPGAATSP